MALEYNNKQLSNYKVSTTYVDASLITRDTTIIAHTNELLVHDTSLGTTVQQYDHDTSIGIGDASGNIGDMIIIDSSMYFKQRDGATKALQAGHLWVSWPITDSSIALGSKQ